MLVRYLRVPIFIRDKVQRERLTTVVDLMDFVSFDGKHLVKVRYLEDGPPSKYRECGKAWESGEIRYDAPGDYMYINLETT